MAPKLAAINVSSTQVGRYRPQEYGKYLWSRAGTMIRKRSSHIPSTMVHDAIAVPVMVRKRFMARIGTGIRKLQNTMIQKSGANCWRMLVQKTAISEGVLPYQVVIRSAKVK